MFVAKSSTHDDVKASLSADLNTSEDRKPVDITLFSVEYISVFRFVNASARFCFPGIHCMTEISLISNESRMRATVGLNR